MKDKEDNKDEEESDIDVDFTPLSKVKHIPQYNGKIPLFYPDNKCLQNWDLFMLVILVITCMITPTRLAFVKPHETET